MDSDEHQIIVGVPSVLCDTANLAGARIASDNLLLLGPLLRSRPARRATRVLLYVFILRNKEKMNMSILNWREESDRKMMEQCFVAVLR